MYAKMLADSYTARKKNLQRASQNEKFCDAPVLYLLKQLFYISRVQYLSHGDNLMALFLFCSQKSSVNDMFLL